jgi:hypothetical protein
VPYQDAILVAFQGGRQVGPYLATGEDLGIQLQVFSQAPPLRPAETVEGFRHTLIVALVDRAMLDKAEPAVWDWLAEYWELARASQGRHALLAVPMEERIGDAFLRKRPSLANLQLLQHYSLGERAIRPAMLALRLLHECRRLLATGLTADGGNAGHLRLFISHAKMDSLPLAQALRHLIDALGWLHRFYDVDDLPEGCDWQRELERGVGSSLIVMLRTEAYDGRFWCQQEVLWADEYATPAVLVDARTNLNHPAATLPFDRVPTVRIPDGNLLRILFVALREGLRFLLFSARVELMAQSGALPSPVVLRVFTFAPSMAALLRACRALEHSKAPATTPRLILYPDPPLRAGLYEAANALVESYAPPGTRLVTPNAMAATKGGT